MAKTKFEWEGDGLPPLTLGDYAWEGQINLPVWKGWACEAERVFGGNGAPSTGSVEVEVTPPDDEDAEPVDEQCRALLTAIRKQEAIQERIVAAVLPHYTDLIEQWGGLDFLSETPGGVELPLGFKGEAELKSHARLSRIYVHTTFLNKSAYVGYGFECSWDLEHGLGVLMHDKKVIAVGDEETAFMAHELDDYDRKHNPERIADSKVAPEELNHIDINHAVLEGNLAWVKALLDDGASPDKRYHGGGSVNAIEMAASHGREEILAELLKSSSSTPRADAIAPALYQGYVPVARMLCEAGAKPKLEFLYRAIEVQDRDAVALLVEYGVKPDSRCRAKAMRVAENAADSGLETANSILGLLQMPPHFS